MRFIFILFILFSVEAQTANFKVRAREHYEVHKLKVNNTSYTYRGFSNTINFWWEDPYRSSFGFAVGPLLGLAQRDSALVEDYIVLYTLGVERKVFSFRESLPGLFTRTGFGWNHLQINGPMERINGPKANGWSVYAGVGWELNLDFFSLALEVAFRYVSLPEGMTDEVFTPSMGFHFYKML